MPLANLHTPKVSVVSRIPRFPFTSTPKGEIIESNPFRQSLVFYQPKEYQRDITHMSKLRF